MSLPSFEPTFGPPFRLFRHTWVQWVPRSGDTAQLRRATTDEREVIGWADDAARYAEHLAVSAEEIAEFWACSKCGRVIRHPRGNSFATEVLIKHRTSCVHAVWRQCRSTSEVLGTPMEYADGIDARRWRCVECKREHSDDQITIRVNHPLDYPASTWPRTVVVGRDKVHLSWLHHRTCSRNPAHRPASFAPQRLASEREALGQAALFSLEVHS